MGRWIMRMSRAGHRLAIWQGFVRDGPRWPCFADVIGKRGEFARFVRPRSLVDELRAGRIRGKTISVMISARALASHRLASGIGACSREGRTTKGRLRRLRRLGSHGRCAALELIALPVAGEWQTSPPPTFNPCGSDALRGVFMSCCCAPLMIKSLSVFCSRWGRVTPWSGPGASICRREQPSVARDGDEIRYRCQSSARQIGSVPRIPCGRQAGWNGGNWPSRILSWTSGASGCTVWPSPRTKSPGPIKIASPGTAASGGEFPQPLGVFFDLYVTHCGIGISGQVIRLRA